MSSEHKSTLTIAQEVAAKRARVEFTTTTTNTTTNDSNSTNSSFHPITKSTLEAALARVRPYVKETPVLTSDNLNELIGQTYPGCSLFFKCENFQKTGSFKFRGACNAVFSLSEEDAKKGC